MADPPAGDAGFRLTLDIDTRTRPISGRLTDISQQLPFSGWLELAAVLHNAIESGVRRSPSVPGASPPQDEVGRLEGGA